MNVNNTNHAGFLEPAPGLSPRGFELRKIVGKVVRGVATFAKTFGAAQIAARQAQRYYAMSDAQLARVGLTRDQIPDELIRVLTH